mmetsp:Transcript_22066/g.28382  ORF Transcript_22066/g.28382 Transcript_22066/m.28382 type:complete len:200 (-) Transcript_22066:345-944(-)
MFELYECVMSLSFPPRSFSSLAILFHQSSNSLAFSSTVFKPSRTSCVSVNFLYTVKYLFRTPRSEAVYLYFPQLYSMSKVLLFCRCTGNAFSIHILIIRKYKSFSYSLLHHMFSNSIFLGISLSTFATGLSLFASSGPLMVREYDGPSSVEITFFSPVVVWIKYIRKVSHLSFSKRHDIVDPLGANRTEHGIDMPQIAC